MFFIDFEDSTQVEEALRTSRIINLEFQVADKAVLFLEVFFSNFRTIESRLILSLPGIIDYVKECIMTGFYLGVLGEFYQNRLKTIGGPEAKPK